MVEDQRGVFIAEIWGECHSTILLHAKDSGVNGDR
jgi:hypothetical protein